MNKNFDLEKIEYKENLNDKICEKWKKYLQIIAISTLALVSQEQCNPDYDTTPVPARVGFLEK